MKKTTTIFCALCLGAGMVSAATSHAEVTQQDKDFLVTASQGNYDEIKLSELAEKKATDPQVKQFAHLMVVQHKKLGEKMMPFGDKWGLPPVMTLDPEHQAEYDKLSGLSGAEFDKEYMNAMDMDHHKTLDAFNQELQSTTDQKFKATVAQGQTVVAQHTQMADSLQSKLG
jgi:putative membrane protein